MLAGSYESIALICQLSTLIQLIAPVRVCVPEGVHVLLRTVCVSRSITVTGRTLQRTFLRAVIEYRCRACLH